MGEHWSLRLRIFLFFLLIIVGGTGAIAGALLFGFLRLGQPAAVSAFVLSGAVACFTIAGLVAWVWLRFDEHVAKPIDALASDLRARAHAAVTGELDQSRARHLGDLAPAAAALSSALGKTRGALDAAVARETARITQDKSRLEAILRDLAEGVILCTAKHQIALYNRQAVALLHGAGELGLDRPLFELLRPGPALHAYERLTRASGGERASDLLCTTHDGSRVLHGRMRLIGGDAVGTGPDGYVLTLRDITEDLAAHAAREHLLRETIEQIRRPAANLQTTLDVLNAHPDLEPAMRERLQAALAGETAALAARITDLGQRNDLAAARWWPMADVAARDLLDSLTARLEAQGMIVETDPAPLTLHCDGFALVQLLGGLTQPLRAIGGPERLCISAQPDPMGAVIDIMWDGPVLPLEVVERWLAEPLPGGYGVYTGRDALESHGTDFWPDRSPQGRARLRLPLRQARIAAPRAPLRLRPEFYDFGLFSPSAPGLADERELETLTYVVFDTETTGLEPSAGDEIVQIAAIRIVSGRLLSGEIFETLVNPRRRIPLAAARIHGVTDDMVVGAPDIAEAGRRFHRFCADAVLVAHNAPFDMAFLRRHEQAMGCRFDHPVLDTILMSAVLYGESAEHSLDALAERLGITLKAADRHTALGDAMATAEAFLTMLPMLRAKGVGTLAQITRQFQQCRRIQRRQAAY